MKRLILGIVMVSIFMVGIKNVLALNTIPHTMTPNTIIKYLNESEYVVLKGEEKENSLYNEELFEEVQVLPKKMVTTESIYYLEEYPTPRKDLYVYYGDDGQVTRIYSVKGSPIYSITSLCYQDSDIQPLISLTEPTDKIVAKWGGYPNILYKQTTHLDYYKFKGKGMATTFKDKIGEKDNTLKKGDVATKMEYGDIAFNSVVEVTTKNNKGQTMTVNMVKRDKGGMPNAIIDIWKTGVEYWGYTYNESLSLDNVTIRHN